MSDRIPDAHIEPAPRWIWQRASMVWLIPMLALLVAFGVAWQSFNNLGRVVQVSFADGSGIAANATELRYRDIKVGVVEELSLSPGLERVIATIRLDKKIEPYVDSNAQFWIVRPEVTTQGVTGLDTVLSGVFIEGSWDNIIGDPTSDYIGLPDEPLFRADRPGLQIALRGTAKGNLVSRSPILYRGIEVGRIGQATINPRGNYAVADAIIYEPHDRLITNSTRFWDTSGFSFTVGPSGASLDFTSLASLIAGGITFDTLVSGGALARDGSQFQVYESEAAARTSVFDRSEVEELLVSVVFDDNISGLAVEAPVELGGLRIGTVSSVNGIIDPDRFGDNQVRLNAVLSIQPTRLGLQETASADSALAFLEQNAQDGFRARLASTSLLTSALKVEFVQVSDARTEQIARTPDGLPILPTTNSEISDAAGTVEGLLARVNNLPVEDLMISARDFLDVARGFIANDDLQNAPGDLRLLLSDVRGVVASQDVQEAVPNLNRVLVQLETILTEVQTEQTITRLVAAIDAAAQTARQIDGSFADVPALVAELTRLAETAGDLPLDALTDQATSLVDTAQALLASDGAQGLPQTLNSALQEVDATLKDLRSGGAVDNVNLTLDSAREAADAFAASTQDLPGLIARVTRVLQQASATIEGYDRGEEISRDAQATMRDIQKAADAIAALARTIERNPSALIRGR